MARKFPDVLTILIVFMGLFTVLTWLIPAGEFERKTVDKRQLVVAGTYHTVAQQGQGPMDFLMAPWKGLVAAADIIAFVFLVAGAFGVVNKTGAIAALLDKVIVLGRTHPRYKLGIVSLLMVLFSLGGSIFGMAEEVLVFVLLTLPLARALGYDAIVGAAIPFVGAGAGFAGAFINPFTVGIAQGIAQLPPGSGSGYRVVCWLIFTVAATAFVCAYATRIENEPERSLMKGIDEQTATPEQEVDVPPLTPARIAVLLALMVAIGLLVYGVKAWGWYIGEIAALFVGLGLVCAFVARLSADDCVRAFTEGASDVLMAAMIIGFSRGLLVLAENGKIIDTVLSTLAGLGADLAPSLAVTVMFLFQSFLNFFVPSGSGQAALTMPLMAPLSDLLGISRQVAVLAFQFGDGISNLIIPTSGVTMGVLEMSRIPYDRWFRFGLPLVLMLSALALVLLVFPVTVFSWE